MIKGDDPEILHWHGHFEPWIVGDVGYGVILGAKVLVTPLKDGLSSRGFPSPPNETGVDVGNVHIPLGPFKWGL